MTEKTSREISTAKTGTVFCHITPALMPSRATPVFQATAPKADDSAAVISRFMTASALGFRLGAPIKPTARASTHQTNSQGTA